MTDENEGRRPGDAARREGLGDDQGTRVGSPTPQKSTGMGSEATEGIHAADGDREEADPSSLEGKEIGRAESEGMDRAGSEPIESHDSEHRSKYGGGSRKEQADGGGQRQ